ncbi:unnamed protein product [Rotaria sp. Silwood2]|nr:unnamed protein product [Rotaria sp. Silwood2]CAF2791890.1 unnamed protein product [Rotaria sp. Silwood2]CAF3186441.1 unnamed protein product [Rotaria sp. Silwood2]CAF3959331.1 unnamed protein product [Rotaria sp. Silwood2]CAF4098589.1 unnamed protein product [Rotaria sp. Silwood2]
MLCSTLYFARFFSGYKRRRRRQKKNNDLEHCFELSPASGRAHQQLLSEKSQQENHELRQGSSVTIINYLQTSSAVTVTRVNRIDNTFIDKTDNVRSKQSSGKSVDCSHYLNSSAYAPEIDRQDKITKTLILIQTPNQNSVRIQSVLQDSPDIITFPSSASTPAKKNRFAFMKLPRLIKSSVEPHQATSTIDSTTQLNEIQYNSINNSDESKISVQPLSHVSVDRIKRSSSAGAVIRTIQRRTIVSSHANLNRIKVTNFK